MLGSIAPPALKPGRPSAAAGPTCRSGCMLERMPADNHRAQVLHALRVSSQLLDDDQLAVRTGIAPRQAVNQLCRGLEREGLLRRFAGPNNKIVNELTGPRATETQAADIPSRPRVASAEDAIPAAAITLASGHTPPPGNSHEQRQAERVMLDLLSEQLGHRLDPARITIASGARVEVDGADPDKTVLVECWAHQGPPKAAQRHKVLSDALKLTWIASTLYPRPELILCLSDRAAAAPFLPGSRSWAAQALHDLHIKIKIVTLPEELRAGLRSAQQRQYR